MAKKKPRPTAPATPPPGLAPPRGAPRGRLRSRVFDVLVLFVLAWTLVQLAAVTSHHRFFTDECYHAYVSEWIAGHGTLPRTLPAFYSGFYYYYPPLYHLIGAAWIKLLGAPALRSLNLFLTALLLGVLHLGVPRTTRTSAGRWAVLLCAANRELSIYAVRLFTEALIALLTAAAFLLLLRVARRERWRDAACLGGVFGLTLLAKQSAPLLLGLLLVLAAIYAIRRRSRLALQLLAALALGLAVATPYFVRNLTLYGSPFYPIGGPDIDRDLYRTTMTFFSSAPAALYRNALAMFGPWLLAMFAIALVARIARRQWDLTLGLMAYCVIVVAVAPLFPIHEPRHLYPILPVVALLASLAIAEAAPGRGMFADWISGALLTLVLGSLLLAPPRVASLEPELERACQVIRERTPADATVLSLWTYDTAYYSGRRATWPIPWGQAPARRPLELFRTTDPDRFLQEMERDSIDFVLLPTETHGGPFRAVNYPGSLVQCLLRLIADHRLTVVWRAPSYSLVGRSRPAAAPR